MKTITIEGCDWVQAESKVIKVTAFCRVETDGTGAHHGDETAQNQTTYKPNLNADKDFFIAVPKWVRVKMDGVIIGCHVRVQNLMNGKYHDAVVGDVGPNDRSGEVSRCLAIALGVDPNPNTGGSTMRKFLYTIYADVPANVDGKLYKLQPL